MAHQRAQLRERWPRRRTGGSVFFGSGYAGVSVDDLRNHYGVTAEPDVNIRMQRQRVATAGEWAAGAAITKLAGRPAANRYEHQESKAMAPWAPPSRARAAMAGWKPPTPRWRWARPSSAACLAPSGSSSTSRPWARRPFVPSTHTRQTGVFLLEQLDLAGAQLTAGLRQERVTVRSEGDADASDAVRPAQARSFQPRSLALAPRCRSARAGSSAAI